jgi:hypothetical protein
MNGRKCERCGSEYIPDPRGKGKFCSRECWHAYQRENRSMAKCERCGAEFYARPATILIGKGKYCSKACSVPALAQAKTRTIAERFWEKVRKGDGCWEWIAGTDPNGYGRLSVKMPDGRYIPYLAHRMAWEIENGPIPEGLGVLHSCDNPPCCRIEHLFLGDQGDNMQDCAAKDRTTRGERSASAKVTESQVREMRRRFEAGGITMAALGREFGLNPRTACDIIGKRRWAHVD